MHTIYLGYSQTLSAREVMGYFDVRPEEDGLISKFEEEFGGEYIDPGDFEVYDHETYGRLDATKFASLLPFEPDKGLLERLDFLSSRSVFFVRAHDLVKASNEDMTLIGPMMVAKFDFED